MEKLEIQKQYNQNYRLYSRLAENLKQACTTFLEDKEIPYHTISSRIKEFDSFFEKIGRKGYDNPIDQIEDFCGLRIICYYTDDLENIADIIHNEFEVLDSIDKTSILEIDRFGYRSNHFIVRIKKDWANAPNYRGLEGLKTEIQIRTILMHSWADIEHELAYKKKEQIPGQFRRRLYQLSALLEIADAQFQELKNGKELLRNSLIIENQGTKQFDFSQELNLDSFQAYLDFTFPNRQKTNKYTSDLLEQLIESNISLNDLEKMRKSVESILEEVENEMDPKTRWAQVGIVRAILDLKSDLFWKKRLKVMKSSDWGKTILIWRNNLKKEK